MNTGYTLAYKGIKLSTEIETTLDGVVDLITSTTVLDDKFHEARDGLKGATDISRDATQQIEQTAETLQNNIQALKDQLSDALDNAQVGKNTTLVNGALEQLARHSMIDITLKAAGDLHIDFHHTAEDTGIVLGQAVAEALGDKKGITRYADVHLPMDDTLTRVAVDVSGRPYLVWKVEFSKPKVGEMDTELFREWFQAFAQNARITLHVENLYGENNHHIAETCYKGLARALRRAVEPDPRQAGRVPSTKGTLTG